LIRLASFVLCLFVIASFGIFAIDQTKTASSHQQEELANGAAPSASRSGTGTHEGSLHRTIDEVAEEVTSPFAGIVSSSSSEWASRSVKLLLALLVYGFGLGYLARVLRVRGVS
jgi:hypothetical protein